MKKYGLFLAVVFVLFVAGTSNALVQVEVLPPTTCVRGTGEPLTETFTFPGVSGQATVKLWNGSLEDDSIEKVSSSIVTVNGQVVFGPSEFSQHVGYLEKETTLVEGQNTLEVCLKGKPGGQLTIQIIQEVEGEGAAFIGSEGGMVEVADPESPIFGTKIEIPENVVENNTYFTISKASNEIQPPNDNTNVSEGLVIRSSAPLNGYVIVTCPLNVSVTDEDRLIVSHYNEEINAWALLPLIDINYQAGTVQFATDHFKNFFVQKITRDFLPESWSNFRVNRDSFNQHIGNPNACKGMSNFSVWYYLKHGQDVPGLRCAWHAVHANEIAKEAQNVFLSLNLIGRAGWEVVRHHVLNYQTGVKNDLMEKLSSEDKQPQVFHMEPKIIGGPASHTVVVIGYKQINDSKVEFYCYDPNFPDEPKGTEKIDCEEAFPGLWYFSSPRPEYKDYIVFYPAYYGDKEEVDSEFEGIISSYGYDNWCDKSDADSDSMPDDIDNCPNHYNPLQEDSDGDGILCDDCPDTPISEPVNENGCSFTQLSPGLTSPDNEQANVDPDSVTFGWQPVLHPGDLPVEYCVTVKQDAEPEDIPVFMGCDDEIFTSETSFILPISLEPGKTYWWAVWAKDENGNWSEASEWWTFTTTPDPSDVDDDGDDYTENQGDCNDNDSSIYPGATEVCGDGIDNNCDGQVDEGCGPIDSDGDGIPDDQDAFPSDPNEWADSDNDNVGDNSDNCPDTYNPAQIDSDGDGIGDACEVDLSDGLVAYWSFDNGDATDDSGNGYDGIIYGNPECVDSVKGTAFRFDGIDDYIQVDNFDFQNRNQLSVVLWAKPDATGIDGAQNFVSKHGSQPDVEILLRTEADGKYDVEWTIGNNFYDLTSEQSGMVNDSIGIVEPTYNAYDLIAAIYDGSQIRFYVNGELVKTKDATGDIVKNSYPLSIGAYAPFPNNEPKFKGILDEIRIYNRALSEAEVQNLFGEGLNEGEGLVAHYPLNGNALDESGNGNHGTVYGSSLIADRFGSSKSAYSFDGMDDYISIPELLTPSSPAFTFSTWVLNRSGTNYGSIVYKGTHKGEAALTHNQGTFQFQVKLADHNWYYAQGPSVTLDKYLHVVGVYYKGDRIEIWVNGELKSQTSIPDLDLVTQSTHSSSIGAYNRGQTEPWFFDGIIDDVRIYDRALSGAEIQVLYNLP